ncbi:MAG TPA: hypothetical protein VJ844_09945 [Mucilaginibacter sp.]|nr:hypothetical protein [Mucilaginibacter sp.]
MESIIKFIGKIHSPLKSLDDYPLRSTSARRAQVLKFSLNIRMVYKTSHRV